MTEREKMIGGQLYDASDPELKEMRRLARRLTRDYNETTEDEEERRRGILRDLLGALGESASIEPPFRCDYGSHIYLGDRVYMNFNCVVLDCASVTIGDDVMLGPGVQIYTAHHPIEAHVRVAGPELASPIFIGSRCWIGGGAILLPGVSIGEYSTIGAGSVVTRDIPANVVAAGNPCRVIRRIKDA